MVHSVFGFPFCRAFTYPTIMSVAQYSSVNCKIMPQARHDQYSDRHGSRCEFCFDLRWLLYLDPGRTRWYQLFLPALKLGKVFQRQPKSIVQLESIPWHCKRLRAVLYKFPKKLRPHSKKTINIYHNHTWVYLFIYLFIRREQRKEWIIYRWKLFECIDQWICEKYKFYIICDRAQAKS